MKVGGLQKLTLLDFPGKVACTVFTVGCNLRCPFCHNASLVTHIQDAVSVTEDDLYSFLKKRAGILDGICVSGGEPTLQKDLPEFLKKLKDLGYLVKLDTNGTSPEILSSLMRDGLVDYVALDIKNSPEKYALTCGNVDLFDKIKGSVSLLLSGNIDYEFRTTVVNGFHEVSDFESIGRFIHGAKRYYLQAFVDSGDLISKDCSGISEEMMRKMLDAVTPFVHSAEIRGI